MLARSRRFYEQTGGVFDVTIAPVGRLWRRARRDRKLPDPQKIAEARALVGSDKMVLDPTRRTVQLTQTRHEARRRRDRQGVRLAGGRSTCSRELGITRALVGGAGDIVVGDPPPDAQGWTIGVAPSNPDESEPETYLLLKNAAISTAGDAERFVIIDGHRYSHIINPVTGAAVEDRASVTVVAPDGATADALETSVYLLGPERGLKLIEETPGAAALYVALDALGGSNLRIITIQDDPPDKTQAGGRDASRGASPGARIRSRPIEEDRRGRRSGDLGRKVPGAVVIVGRRGQDRHTRGPPAGAPSSRPPKP